MIIRFEKDLTATQISNLSNSDIRNINCEDCNLCKKESRDYIKVGECRNILVLEAMKREK